MEVEYTTEHTSHTNARTTDQPAGALRSTSDRKRNTGFGSSKSYFSKVAQLPEALTISQSLSVAASRNTACKQILIAKYTQQFDRSQNSDTHTRLVHDLCITRRSESFSFSQTTHTHTHIGSLGLAPSRCGSPLSRPQIETV